MRVKPAQAARPLPKLPPQKEEPHLATGQLSFSVSTAQQALPVEAVQVVITKVSEGQVVYDQTLITD